MARQAAICRGRNVEIDMTVCSIALRFDMKTCVASWL
jgi:hypothetical protein